MSFAGKIILRFLRTFPHVRNLEKRVDYFEKSCVFPVGHYYSPIVNLEDFRSQQLLAPTLGDPSADKAIDFNDQQQLNILRSFKDYYNEMPWTYPQKTLRYQFDNNFFTKDDAITMYGMLRYFKPKKIIEVGVGFSSALLLDTNDHFLNSSIELTFIDPYPERLEASLRDNEKVNLLKSRIQDVPLSRFGELESGDFLLIDTSHVSKSGSDVNYIFFTVFPLLKPGVKVHIHDVFFPFEYPEKWVVENRLSWNELFLLRAFLSYNEHFRITFFNTYLRRQYPALYSDAIPFAFGPSDSTSGGIWIERV